MRLKLIFTSFFIFIFLVLFNSNFVFAESVVDKSNEYNGLAYKKAILKEGVEPPYSLNNEINEDIDPATGTINLKQTDINLKGRNGLDFSLSRYYSQNNSALFEPYVTSSANYATHYQFIGYYVDVTKKVFKCVNGIVLDSTSSQELHGYYDTYSEAQAFSSYVNSLPRIYGADYYDPQHESYVYDVTEYSASGPLEDYDTYRYIKDYTYNNNIGNSTSNDKYSDLGSGWSFDLPYIETVGGYEYLNYGSAGAWQIDFGSSGGQSHLKNYPLIDMKLNNDNQSYYNGQAYSNYVLEHKDGKKTFFGSDGRLLGIKDRFNNEIKFQHDTSRTGCPIINKIIDSVGREINISYSASQVLVTVNDMTDATKNKTITYNKIAIPGYSNKYKLDNFIDPMNRVTRYEYTVKAANVNLSNKNISGGVTNQFACLTKIVSPTSGESIYNYSKIIKNCGNDGVMESYKLYERYDSKNDGVKYNYKKFNYLYGSTGEFDGYPSYNSEASIPSSYTFKTQVLDGLNNSEIYTYDKKLLPINILVEGIDHKNETINEYDSTTKLLVKNIYKIFNKATGKSMQKIENYEYSSDGYRDMIGYWDSQATRDSNNIPIDNVHKVTFTYEPMYHYPLTKTFNKDSLTVITEEYIPTSDKKAVQWKKTKENGILKSQTWYDYDIYGNITEEKRYLEDWSSSISTKFDYSDNNSSRNGKFNGAYLTRKWVDNVKNIDEVVNNSPGISIDEVFRYDWYGNLVEKKDRMGYLTKYGIDKLGRVIKETHPDQTFKTWVYTTNSNENSVTITDENNIKIKHLFDKFGNVEKELDITSGQYLNQYTYDNQLRLKTESNLNTSTSYRTITYNYYNDSRLSEKITTDQENTIVSKESYTYDDAFDNGNYLKETKTILGDINSPSMIENTYIDKMGRLRKQGRVHKVQGTDKEYIDSYEYDFVGNKISEKTARAYDEAATYPSCEYTTKYDYDYAGNVIKTTNADGTFATAKYDALGRLKSTADFKSNLTSPEAYSTTYVYDNLGRLIQETIPFEKADTTGKVYYTVKKHYYDRNGNIISEMVSNSKPDVALTFSKVDYEYNGRNMLTKVITYNKGNPENYTQYYYDNSGNKLRMYTGLNKPLNITGLDIVATTGDTEYSTTKYEYDRFGKLIKMIEPTEKTESYMYDLNGNLLNKIDKNGSNINMTYDAMGRLINNTVTNTENPESNNTYAYTYTLTGNRKTMSSGGVDTTYYYDDLGRLTKEEASNGTLKEYTYDVANNKKSLVVKVNGVTRTNTSYSYDKMNRLNQVFENGSLIATYTYDTNGNRDTLTTANGNVSAYKYNIANKLKLITNKKGTTVLSRYEYSHLLDGNQAAKTDNNGKLTSYIYDGLGRLTSEAPGGEPTISYTYDDSNNRSSMTVSGSSITTYAYDKANRLQAETKAEGQSSQITRYNYDDNGNTICKTVEVLSPVTEDQNTSISLSDKNSDVTLYEYDGFNQLTKTTTGDATVTYTYNGDGLRTSKAVNGNTTRHIWDGDQIALELNNAGTVTNKYVRGINLIYSEDGAGANKRYFQYNGHGDTTQLTDTSGNVVKSYDYDSFGNEKNPDANDTNVFRYCGEYFDKETGTIYLRARYYDPGIGRFITEDTYPGEANDPLSLNLYVYVGNNPVNFFDPDGHDAILITNSESAFKQGHTSAVYQDSKGDWYYTYWGDKASAVIRIPDKYIVSQSQYGNVTTTFTADSMTSLDNFNGALNRFLSDNGYGGIVSDYTSATYVMGDFTASLDAAYDDVDTAFNNKKSSGTLYNHDDGSAVYQGKNGAYNVLTNNCLQRTVSSFGKGTMADGTSVATYLRDKGYTGYGISGVRPNSAAVKFRQIFKNSSFTKAGAIYEINGLYMQFKAG